MDTLSLQRVNRVAESIIPGSTSWDSFSWYSTASYQKSHPIKVSFQWVGCSSMVGMQEDTEEDEGK